MAVDDFLFIAVHAAVTDLNGVVVEYFMRNVVLGGMYAHRCKESVPNVCTNILT